LGAFTKRKLGIVAKDLYNHLDFLSEDNIDQIMVCIEEEEQNQEEEEEEEEEEEVVQFNNLTYT